VALRVEISQFFFAFVQIFKKFHFVPAIKEVLSFLFPDHVGKFLEGFSFHLELVKQVDGGDVRSLSR